MSSSPIRHAVFRHYRNACIHPPMLTWLTRTIHGGDAVTRSDFIASSGSARSVAAYRLRALTPPLAATAHPAHWCIDNRHSTFPASALTALVDFRPGRQLFLNSGRPLCYHFGVVRILHRFQPLINAPHRRVRPRFMLNLPNEFRCLGAAAAEHFRDQIQKVPALALAGSCSSIVLCKSRRLYTSID